ncbi:MAG: glycosyl hydrolase 53 family protein [Prevotella sp.]|nr:glycosyl hydrolase 53 family protein [Prevotella sp.]
MILIKRIKWLVITITCLFMSTTIQAQELYVGGDISMLLRYEDYNVAYYDQGGARIDDVLDYMKSEAVGWNAQRVRLFVNPTPSLDGNDSAICQDLDYVIRLGKRIKEAGFAFMLDFHYSDVWADPAKQWTPVAWESLSDAELQAKIYDYTKDCLQRLVEAGATPDFIQTGNEISYGMLWGKKGSSANRCYVNSDAGWARFVALLQQAGKACREVCPQAKIVIHTERAGQSDVLKGIYERLSAVDYDVIGLSYYPFWHNGLSTLSESLNVLATAFPDKKVQIVETAYYYQWQPKQGNGIDYDFSSTWAVSPEGQAAYAKDLIAELKKHDNVNGLYWWFPEENGEGPNNAILNGWVNRGLWDDNTHRALPGLYVLKDFFNGATGISNVPVAKADDEVWYTLQGVQLNARPTRPGIYVSGNKKVIVK